MLLGRDMPEKQS